MSNQIHPLNHDSVLILRWPSHVRQSQVDQIERSIREQVKIPVVSIPKEIDVDIVKPLTGKLTEMIKSAGEMNIALRLTKDEVRELAEFLKSCRKTG